MPAGTASVAPASPSCPRRSRRTGIGTSPTWSASTPPADPVERKLVEAVAAAMWKEIRADRIEADALTAMAPDGGAGADPRVHARSTSIRYAAAAGAATRRAQLAFLEHRKGSPRRPPGARAAGQELRRRRHEGYDRSCRFIQTFVADHLAHRAAALRAG